MHAVHFGNPRKTKKVKAINHNLHITYIIIYGNYIEREGTRTRTYWPYLHAVCSRVTFLKSL